MLKHHSVPETKSPIFRSEMKIDCAQVDHRLAYILLIYYIENA